MSACTECHQRHDDPELCPAAGAEVVLLGADPAEGAS